MYKITAVIGSARKKGTYNGVKEFEKSLKGYTDCEFEYVFLNDYDLGFCNGCKLCFDKGEEFCPLKDDRDALFEKLESSDGIVFASPNYSFGVSARMKNFLDRLSYMYHRPRLFGKTFTAIVTQGIFGGNKIRRYLESMGSNLGLSVTKGCCLNTLEPMSEKHLHEMENKTGKAAKRFYLGLAGEKQSKPSFFKLMMFRMTRTSLNSIDIKLKDYYYFKEKGWFDSDYYHETKLGIVKKAAGRIFDFMGKQLAKIM